MSFTPSAATGGIILKVQPMSIPRLLAPLAFLVAAMGLAVPAQAQMVDATNPETIRDIVESGRWSAALNPLDENTPMIVVTVEDSGFMIVFMDCDQGKNCRSLQFFTRLAKQKEISQERLNWWNDEMRFVRAILDKNGDPILKMDVPFGEKGMPRETFEANLSIWGMMMTHFARFLSE